MMRGCARSRNSTVSVKACLVARDSINIKESRLFMYILNNSDILFGSFLCVNAYFEASIHLILFFVSNHSKQETQIAIICWDNASILSAVSLARRRQMTFHSSGQLNYQPLVRCWSNAFSPTSPAYANVMPTILFQESSWVNVGPT